MALESSFRVTPSSATGCGSRLQTCSIGGIRFNHRSIHRPTRLSRAGSVLLPVMFMNCTASGQDCGFFFLFGFFGFCFVFLRMQGCFFRGIINEIDFCRTSFNKSSESRPAFILEATVPATTSPGCPWGGPHAEVEHIHCSRLSESQMVPAGGLLPHLAPKRALYIATRHKCPAVRRGRCHCGRLSVRRLGVARRSLSLPPALGKYSGQAVANTPLTVVSPRLHKGRWGGGERRRGGRDLSFSQHGRQGEFRISSWHVSRSLSLAF